VDVFWYLCHSGVLVGLYFDLPMADVVALPLQNIRLAFLRLGDAVRNSLRTQLGDVARLNEQKRICLQFMSNLHPVCTVSQLI